MQAIFGLAFSTRRKIPMAICLKRKNDVTNFRAAANMFLMSSASRQRRTGSGFLHMRCCVKVSLKEGLEVRVEKRKGGAVLTGIRGEGRRGGGEKEEIQCKFHSYRFRCRYGPRYRKKCPVTATVEGDLIDLTQRRGTTRVIHRSVNNAQELSPSVCGDGPQTAVRPSDKKHQFQVVSDDMDVTSWALGRRPVTRTPGHSDRSDHWPVMPPRTWETWGLSLTPLDSRTCHRWVALGASAGINGP
ncbi:hypothetical protein EGW08_001715 [Elysia chlorotica]|uniref:Uncharacterized protein n=1 Tax=Elysia chlorotica TaxID=188477 RepID=A0A3S1BKR4_ELYCH|nr:hypothetical protein EGW08_001715 [Elysia chlorotica]